MYNCTIILSLDNGSRHSSTNTYALPFKQGKKSTFSHKVSEHKELQNHRLILSASKTSPCSKQNNSKETTTMSLNIDSTDSLASLPTKRNSIAILVLQFEYSTSSIALQILHFELLSRMQLPQLISFELLPEKYIHSASNLSRRIPTSYPNSLELISKI